MAETFEDNQYLISRGTTYDALRSDQKHTDVVVVTSDGQKFPCHKIILIGGCPFFSGLFASDMKETRQNEVNLNRIDISGPLFKQVLEFIYTGKITLNVEDAKAINIYAGLFTMTNLKNITEIYLMKNITNENCLELWRHSEKYLMDKLKESCLASANSEVFLDTNVENLTKEEIISIVSLKKLNVKVHLKNIVKWIKTDFEDRQQYIKDLMELINFDDIKDEEFERQIFSDDILSENKEFLKLSVKYLLRPSSSRSYSRASENAVDVPKKTLFIVTRNNISHTDFNTKEFKATKLCIDLIDFGTSCHTTKGFITTGGRNLNTGTAVNLCKQFFPSTSVQNKFPRLIEARYEHRNYTVGSKIYTCGGFNKKTVEVFEENAGKWINGPAMNNDRFLFGAADDTTSSLYAIGGYDEYSYTPLNSIDHLDIRTNSWHTIYIDPSVAVGFTQSVYKDDHIYCFGQETCFIFDIRANQNLATIPYKMDNTMDLTFRECYFDCTLVDNDIWLIGEVIVKNTIEANAFKLDLQTNTWERKMFRGLGDSNSLSLVWCRNN